MGLLLTFCRWIPNATRCIPKCWQHWEDRNDYSNANSGLHIWKLWAIKDMKKNDEINYKFVGPTATWQQRLPHVEKPHRQHTMDAQCVGGRNEQIRQIGRTLNSFTPPEWRLNTSICPIHDVWCSARTYVRRCCTPTAMHLQNEG